MKILCNVCEQEIDFPDARVPRDKAFSIMCPACRARVRVDQHLRENPPEPPKPVQASEPVPEPEPENQPMDLSSLVISTEFEDEDEELLLFDENVPLALVLDETNQSHWTDALEEMGYKVLYARSPEHAMHRMKFHQFQFIALHENFGGSPLEENILYRTLEEMSMSTRREIFFAIVGPEYKTMNHMEAFVRSVNLVINDKDMDKLPRILKKTLTEHDAFYKVFREALHVMGKA